MSRSTYHHGDLRRALVDAAARLVERGGAARVSLREIAREAGVSHAAPYHHFKDREALLAAVATAGFEGLVVALREGARRGHHAGPLAALQGAGVGYVGFAAEHPETYRLMFGGLLSDRGRYPSLKAASDTAFGVLLGLLDHGGENADPAPFDPVALSMWSTVHGLASLLIEGLLAEETSSVPLDEVTRQVTTVLGRGLRAYAGGASGEDA